jgi:hypothetical protein
MSMKTNNSKQQMQQEKQNHSQSVKRQTGNPKLDGENRPST